MKCYAMGVTIEETEVPPESGLIILSDKNHWTQDAEMLGITVDVDALTLTGHFSKVETQTDFLFGQVSVPRVLDIPGKRHEISFLLNEAGILLVDADDYVERILRKIRVKKKEQAVTTEQFLYHFITEILKNDIQILEEYEKRMIRLEDAVMDDKAKDFQKEIVPIRRELLILKGYYEQIGEMGKELEENENSYFHKKGLKLFRQITDKADRLEGKCGQLLAYSQQVRDLYQAQVDAKQNSAIGFLTVVSTIFLPLTLLTSWYGMNFQDMPELENGYPVLIAAAVLIVIGTIVLFKRKGML